MDASRTLLADSVEPRPTLPSLRSLNLPFPMLNGVPGAVLIDRSSINYLNDLTGATNNISSWQGMGLTSDSPVPSMSSSSTDSSRTSSPSPSESSSFLPSSSTLCRRGFRLVPCELQKADAIVLVNEPVDGSSDGKAFLLVGPAAEPYRQHRPRRITKGSRVHPYNIVPSQSLSRQFSSLSLSSQSS